MRASKETAEVALQAMHRIEKFVVRRGVIHKPSDFSKVYDFLKAAKAKLPTEAAYERDRQRKRS